MDKRPVLFLDSGIGGIPYCRYFHLHNPDEAIVYAADNLHFPYGKRERRELVSILISLIENIIQTSDPKIAVLACNTATVSALGELREHFPGLPFVGTVPAVKPAVLASRTGKVGVLGTGRTIEDPYIRELASRYGRAEIHGIAAPELVELVERRIGSIGEEEKRETARGYLDRFRAAGVDSLVLGCTHFLFLLEEFRQEAAPDIAVFDSIEGISRRIESLLDENNGELRGQGASCPKRPEAEEPAGAPDRPGVLLVTGPESPPSFWQTWAAYLGFRLSVQGAA